MAIGKLIATAISSLSASLPVGGDTSKGTAAHAVFDDEYVVCKSVHSSDTNALASCPVLKL
jgi:hypothetical protein